VKGQIFFKRRETLCALEALLTSFSLAYFRFERLFSNNVCIQPNKIEEFCGNKKQRVTTFGGIL